MKAHLFSSKGEKKGQVDLPKIFSSKIRDDIFSKSFEAEKFILRQSYASYGEAGKRHSASGRQRHIRHKWRSAYGKGISRSPRKTMWRRGTQFYWVGAEVSNARGGRRAHPPKGVYSYRKINAKEEEIAFATAFASTFDHELIDKRYSSLKKEKVESAVIESLPNKSKDFLAALKSIFESAESLVFKNRNVRAGRGKTRGRKYKSNAGVLIVKSDAEQSKFAGFDVKSVSEVNLADFAPLGRITLYTKKAVEQIGGKNAA